MPNNHDIKDLLEPHRHSITKEYFGLSPLRALLSILVVVGLGIYVGVLLLVTTLLKLCMNYKSI